MGQGQVYVAKIGAHTTEVDGKEVEVAEQSFQAEYDFGENLEQLQKVVNNDDTIYKAARAQFVIGLRRIIRAAGEVEGATAKSIQERVSKWIPSVTTRIPKDPVQQALSAISGMSQEQRDSLKAALAEDL